EIFPEPMKMTPLMDRTEAQYMASEALVLPVEAHAARLAPVALACVKAADMPLSLKLPEGFIPSCCKYSRPGFMPTNEPMLSDWCRSVCPSPTVTMLSGLANGSNSWNRQTPL